MPAPHRIRRVALGSALVVVGLVAAACSNESGSGSGGASSTAPGETPDAFNIAYTEGEPADGGSITFGVESTIATLDPAGNLAQPSDIGMALAIYDQMVTYEDGEEAPGLALEWENSEDLKTWTFTLREGVTFHDGTPFDADAVVAHMTRLKDPATGCTCAPTVALITSVEAVDPSTVVFTLAEPNAFFPSVLDGPVGMIASPTATEKWGADYARHPVGTGPFVLEDYDSLVLVKNPDYWRTDDEGRRLPYLDEIKVQPVPDARVRLQTIQSGGVDIMQTADTSTVVDAIRDGRFTVQKVTGSGATVTIFNLRRPPFDDIRMRQAVAHAFDRQELNRVVYQGARQEAYSPFAVDSPFYAADVDWPKLDRDKARALIEDYKADGGSVQYTVNCIATEEARQGLGVTQRNGRKVGLDSELEFLDQGAYVNKVLGEEHDFTVGCFRSGLADNADGLYTTLHSEGSGNVMGYSNPRVDELLEAVRATTDQDEHVRLLHEVQEIIAEEVPALPTLYDLFANVAVEGVSGLGVPQPNYLGAIKWAELYRVAE